jgi:hypothetical protein
MMQVYMVKFRTQPSVLKSIEWSLTRAASFFLLHSSESVSWWCRAIQSHIRITTNVPIMTQIAISSPHETVEHNCVMCCITYSKS